MLKIKRFIMWKNNEYKMSFNENAIFEYEKVMLSSGECSFLIPMVFIGEDDRQTAYYNCSGYTPLSHFTVEKTEDALYILEKILLILAHVAEYLIAPARITLNTDTVFYDGHKGDIKIAYVPAASDAVSIRRNLLKLIVQLKGDINDSQKAYLDMVASMVHQNNYQLRDLVNTIGAIRRKLYRETL